MPHHELHTGTEAPALQAALEITGELESVFLATGDADGNAHLEVAEPLTGSVDELVVRGFFDRTTVANLRANPRLTLLAWEPEEGHGFQFGGTLLQTRETAMLDGYSPILDRGMPQVEYELRIHIESVSPLIHQPHRDPER